MISALPPSLGRAVSPYTGIVRSLEESLCTTAEPAIFRAVCEVGRGATLLGAPLDHLTGIGGTGLSREAAAAAAVGEALERYSATWIPRERLVVASARELGAAAVAPGRFALFSERQYADPRFPFRRFTPESRIAWVDATTMPGRESALVPAELVFLADASLPGLAPIGYATSSGAACGERFDEVVSRGLCEVLERDAFMIVWANRLSLPLLDVTAEVPLAELDRRFADTGLSYAAVDLSPFHRLPSVLGVVRAPAVHIGAVGVGAGTAPTVGRAWWKALAEAFSCRAAGAKLRLLAGGRASCSIVSFEDHIRHHADPANAGQSTFLTSSRTRTPVDRVPEPGWRSHADAVAGLCDRVEAAVSTAYVVDVTAPDVRELGLTVGKVLAPELCPLDVPHAARFLGGRRLYDAAVTLGLRDEPLREADVNPHPHPFP